LVSFLVGAEGPGGEFRTENSRDRKGRLTGVVA